VGPRAGLDDAEERKFLTLPELELRPLGRPACTQSLYRLRYPGSHVNNDEVPGDCPKSLGIQALNFIYSSGLPTGQPNSRISYERQCS
jgi:hypothetical protein